VLSGLPTLKLTAKEIEYLVQFYCARLQDFSSVPEVLKGLHAIVLHHQLEAEQPETILRRHLLLLLPLVAVHVTNVQSIQ
jgi:hypothetical protein